jgi:hypothetical protein
MIITQSYLGSLSIASSAQRYTHSTQMTLQLVQEFKMW